MSLEGKWAILYYGILASVTGGWLPIRKKSVTLFVFHLVFFLAFIFIPFAVFHINPDHWSGWFVYSLLILITFLVLKVVNTRLHRSLGSDPVPEEEEQEEEESKEQPNEESSIVLEVGKGREDRKSEDSTDVKEKEQLEVTVEQSLLAEESLKRHRDSASTLGGVGGVMSSGGSHSEASALMLASCRSEPVVSTATDDDTIGATTTSGTEDSTVVDMEQEIPVEKGLEPLHSEGSPIDRLNQDPEASVMALMSPVHRSSSNIDSNATAIMAALDCPHDYMGVAGVGLQDTGIKRAYSMPPFMVDVEGQTPSSRARVCIQRGRGSRGHGTGHQKHRMMESWSEDELTTRERDEEEEEEEGEEEGEEEEGEGDGTGRYPRGRRNAFRSTNARVARRATCAADGSYAPRAAAAVVKATNASEERPDTPIPPLRPSYEDQVRFKLIEEGQYHFLEVIHVMPSGLQKAIVDDTVPISWYMHMKERVGELRRGHLSTEENDSTPGAIHWFEVDGEWDFYMFQPEEPPTLDESLLEDSGVGIEDLYRIMASNYPQLPPRPPPRPTNSYPEGVEEEKKPTYRVVPFIKKSEVTINFPRKALEEYMDRNVTLVETSFTIFLAVLVCIVAALLLSIVDFYQGFWAFWFCFVVGTAQFSLIKSVQDGPASPTPGQNNIMALGRGLFLVFCGTLALCIQGAMNHIETFPILCVYGFNINNEAVLVFVKNGLLIFILFIPILFTLGWIPQADTFAIYFMEQIDMHVFGGTASTGLICSAYTILRNVLVGIVLWGLGYAGFSQLQPSSSGPEMGQTCMKVLGTDYSPTDGGDCKFQDRIALSFFIGALYAASFSLSRSTSNHQYLWELLMRGWQKCKQVCCSGEKRTAGSDPLEDMYCRTLARRLLSDIIISVFILVLVTCLFLSTAFCRSPIPAYVVYGLTCILGMVNHYLIPQLKKELPWLCFGEPIVKAREWDVFEVTDAPKLSPVERILQWLLFIEKNVLYPLTFLFGFGLSVHHYKNTFGDFGAAAVVTLAGMKILRTAWADLPRQYLILIFTLFFFNYDYAHLSEGLPLNYFIIAILFTKFYELFLKMKFIFIYIAPWQSSWSSAGHIIIQPLLIPHTPLIFLQTVASAVMSAPMNPIYASTLFMLSYVRPIKYWEKDYNTKRADSSNTRLETQLEGSLRNPNPDRLDSLFYEHLTWVLQKDLCGDLVLGRWGKVASGDFFILTSDRLNALIHIIEYGNGFVTFQLRGLEFRGTYCHQREVEAITESISDDDGCCCNEPGHLPFMLSCNKVFSSRWLAWEVVSSCYTLHGYSISENQAHLIFNSFDYRKGYITYYVMSIIYRLVRWPRVHDMLNNLELQQALNEQSDPAYCDKDPLFDEVRNSDFSHRHNGILKERFATVFQPFLEVCVELEGLEVECGTNSFLLTLCFAFTILGRRMFYQHAQNGAGRRSGDNFMNGLYRMFLGDARPNHQNDEWVFQDVDSIKEVIIPASRISLKVHQDNFSFSEDYESPRSSYEAISDVDINHVVTHENDKDWRTAVVTNKPSLLALRYQRTEESYIYPYKLIRLTSKFIKFRVIKMNRECVRSLWTSQQHEIIFLHNNDSERGSIQNHKPTLRNMVNSSMDLPIGYPIYVSPLQTSFIDRHETFNKTALAKATDPLRLLESLGKLKSACVKCKTMCAKKVNSSSNRGGSLVASKGDTAQISVSNSEQTAAETLQRRASVDSLTGYQYDPTKPFEDPFPQSDSDSEEQLWKPMWVSKHVVVTRTGEIFDSFKMSWLKWRPDVEVLAHKAQKVHWKAWRPEEGMEGEVIYEWRPFHRDIVQRSHIDKVILLVKMTEDLYVLIKEQGVKEVQGHSVVFIDDTATSL